MRRGITCLKILTKMKLDEFYVLGVHERVGNLEKKETESIIINHYQYNFYTDWYIW